VAYVHENCELVKFRDYFVENVSTFVVPSLHIPILLIFWGGKKSMGCPREREMGISYAHQSLFPSLESLITSPFGGHFYSSYKFVYPSNIGRVGGTILPGKNYVRTTLNYVRAYSYPFVFLK
jgi:hypothetical protein